MLTILCVLAFYIIGGFLIGKPMGKKSLSLWKEKQEESCEKGCRGGFWGFILFPLSFLEERVGKKYYYYADCPFVSEYCGKNSDTNEYLALNFIFYPIRIVWNFTTMFFVVICLIIYVLFKTLKKLM